MPTLFAALTDPDTVMALFEVAQTGLMVIDKDYKVVLVNEEAGRIIGGKPNCLFDLSTCYSLFFNKQAPCADCPIPDAGKSWPKSKSIVIKDKDGADQFIKVAMIPWEEYTVLNLHDVTRELNLLRNVDLTKKELRAKNILLERRQQEIANKSQFLEQLLDHLPDAMVTVNETFAIQRKNAAVATILPCAEGRKCHELLGNEEPCADCPATGGFAAANGQKKSHVVAGRFYTETITASPGVGLLLFRDTTRQIQLIEQIRETRSAITRKNEILSGLVGLGAFMQKETEPRAVIEYFIEMFLPVIKAEKAAVIVNDIREGNLWFTFHKGLDEETVKSLSRAYLTRDVQCNRIKIHDSEFFPWATGVQVDLLGASGKRVGIIVLPASYSDEDGELTKLFTEPLGADIHNRLLMRQLEEKANTDPLTGLYNRGYLDAVMEEESKKQEEFDIPHAVVVADVNGLKKVNDQYGHEAGDAYLLKVTELFKENVRSSDVVARTGGDEFVILLVDANHASAEQFIARLTERAFTEVFLPVGDGELFPVTVSLGAAGSDVFTHDMLLKEADQRMYAAKEAFYKTREKYR
jgi:diguanylate cyclase (GGDEF)-like protein